MVSVNHNQRVRNSGLTQVELVLVAAIIAISAGAAALSFQRALSGSHLQKLVDKTLADMEYARAMSCQEQKSYSIQFRPLLNRYLVKDADGRTLWKVLVDSDDYRVTKIVMALKDDNNVAFDRYGQCDEAGTIEYYAGNEKAVIEITQAGIVRQVE